MTRASRKAALQKKPARPATVNLPPADFVAVSPAPKWTLAPYAIVTLLTLLPWLRSLPYLTTNYFGTASNDIQNAYRHFIAFAYGWLRKGIIPDWNPLLFCGSPFLASTDANIYYPVNCAILALLPQPLSINICLLLHAVFAAASTVFLSKTYGLRPVGATFAGATLGLSSVFVQRIYVGHFTIVCTFAWVPLLFALQKRLIDLPSWRRGVLAGVAAAMLLLCGHWQYAYYTALICGLLFVFTIGRAYRLKSPVFFPIIYAHLITAVVAVGLSAAELLHVADTIGFHSARALNRGAQWLRFIALPPEGFMCLLAPGSFGWYNNYWGRWFWWEAFVYLGVIPLVLAVAGIVNQLVSTRRLDLFALMFVLCLFAATAAYIPGFHKVLQLVPGWSMFRGHSKIACFSVLAAAVLAGRLMDTIHQNAWGPRERLILRYTSTFFFIVAAGGLLASLSGLWMQFLSSESTQLETEKSWKSMTPIAMAHLKQASYVSWSIALLAASVVLLGSFVIRLQCGRATRFVILLSAITLCDLLAFNFFPAGVRFPQTVQRAPAKFWEMASAENDRSRAEAPNSEAMDENLTYGAARMGGNDITVSKYFNTLAAAMAGHDPNIPHFDFTPEFEHPILDAANLVYLGTKKGGRIEVRKRETALPRAYVVKNALFCQEDELSIYQALQTVDSYSSTVLIATNTPPETPPQTGDTKAVAAAVQYHGLTAASVQVDQNSSGWLVLCDAWYPYWTATVNGTPAKIWRANGAFRAVQVPAGARVEFIYKNPWRLAGQWISALSVAVLTILGLLAAFGSLYGRRNR